MQKQDRLYKLFVQLLNEELISATGCTEPIAIALCAAEARALLDDLPSSLEVSVSPSIIKNAKSVVVPNTENLKGIPAAVAAGVVVGKPLKQLDVIAEVSTEERKAIRKFMEQVPISVLQSDSPYLFDVTVTAKRENANAVVRMINHHTNIVHKEKNGQIILSKTLEGSARIIDTTHQFTVEDIVTFANHVDLDDVKKPLEKQIKDNAAIALEGLKGNYGANVGSVLLKSFPNDVFMRAKAMAAAASDARMSGSQLPVTIVSGSGNQGLTASLPVIEYAQSMHASHGKLLRALVVSNLVTLHQKTGVGRLSAYCGAVFAGAGAGAGITYLDGGDYNAIAHTIVNALAVISGMICDGAKPSCAAKIAASVDAGCLGYAMVKNNQEFLGGDGIIAKGIENTLYNISRLARDGMASTGDEILRIMTEDDLKQK